MTPRGEATPSSEPEADADASGSTWLAATPHGYERSGDLQRRFEAAAATLRRLDGWPNPARGGERELRCDLVLEGCGAKAAGLVGAVLALNEAGYAVRAVAGTSAGAVVACLVASIAQSGREMTSLLGYSRSLDFTRFMPEGKVHGFFERAGRVGDAIADAAILVGRDGVYSGDYLEEWLRPILRELGVSTFADLRLGDEVDAERSMGAGRDYRLLVHVSDITRGRLVRLPWDYPAYGHDPDREDPVEAVRASMSIPFIFEPVHFASREALVEVPAPGGGTRSLHFAAGRQTWVDGALLSKFPVHAFDRADGGPSRWPTIGVRLSSWQSEYPATEACDSALDVALHCLRTVMSEWDDLAAHERVDARTVFVDNAGVATTDFDISRELNDRLFLNGVEAATRFVIDAAAAGGVARR